MSGPSDLCVWFPKRVFDVSSLSGNFVTLRVPSMILMLCLRGNRFNSISKCISTNI